MPPIPVNGLSIVAGVRWSGPVQPGQVGWVRTRGRLRSGCVGQLLLRIGASSLGDTGRRRVPARQRSRRGARIEQLGRRRHDDRYRQAAARQRPASQRASAVDSGTRARVGRRLRDDRRDAARRAGGRDRTQPVHRLGRDQRRRRRRGSVIASGLIPTGKSARSIAAQEPVQRDREDDRRQRRAHPVERRASDPSRPASCRTPSTRSTPASPERRKPAVLSRSPSAGRRSTMTIRRSQAFLKLERRAQLERLQRARCASSSSPSQNFVYADVDGHIGYYAPGRIPIRASGDGSRPADGWTGAGEWTGWVPFDALAAHLRSAQPLHRHRQSPARASRTIRTCSGSSGLEPYRAQRITRSARRPPKLTPEDLPRQFRRTRYRCTPGRSLPVLLAHVRPDSRGAATPSRCCRSGTATTQGDSAAPAIFCGVVSRASPRPSPATELGPLARSTAIASRFTFITRSSSPRTLTANDSRWCDDVRSPKRRRPAMTSVTAAARRRAGAA